MGVNWYKSVAAVVGVAGAVTVGAVLGSAPAFADGIQYDLNGDGMNETTIFDEEGNGFYERVNTDTDGDRTWDLILYDRDGNGVVEFATSDPGNDGNYEIVLTDDDQNGAYESIVNRDDTSSESKCTSSECRQGLADAMEVMNDHNRELLEIQRGDNDD